jgi:hypothetical protein
MKRDAGPIMTRGGSGVLVLFTGSGFAVMTDDE